MSFDLYFIRPFTFCHSSIHTGSDIRAAYGHSLTQYLIFAIMDWAQYWSLFTQECELKTNVLHAAEFAYIRRHISFQYVVEDSTC